MVFAAGSVSFPAAVCGVSGSSTARQKLHARTPLPGCQRRHRPPPAACTAAPPTLSSSTSTSGSSSSSSGAGRQSRHFLRPSLLATGLSQPEHVLQHCLALFRKADLAGLRQYLPDAYAEALPLAGAAAAAGTTPAGSSSSGGGSSSAATAGTSVPAAPVLPVGPWVTVTEAGPLAPLAGVLDVGARRVLPGHLLRRSQVLGTLRPTPDTFQQRVALTACTGEAAVFDWLLRWHPADDADDADGSGGSSSSSSSSSSSNSNSSSSGGNSSSGGGGGGGGSGGGGRWVLESVRRDGAADQPLPTTPHPKASPEAIVRAQLAALAGGDTLGAACFSSWRRGAGHVASRRTGLTFHHECLRARLAEEPCGLLLGHVGAQLGAAALPNQREMLQEVFVLGADGAPARFVWRLGMGAQGCWMATGLFSQADLQQEGWQQRQHI